MEKKAIRKYKCVEHKGKKCEKQDTFNTGNWSIYIINKCFHINSLNLDTRDGKMKNLILKLIGGINLKSQPILLDLTICYFGNKVKEISWLEMNPSAKIINRVNVFRQNVKILFVVLTSAWATPSLILLDNELKKFKMRAPDFLKTLLRTWWQGNFQKSYYTLI